VNPPLFHGATWEADVPPISQSTQTLIKDGQFKVRLVTSGRLAGIHEDRTPMLIGAMTPTLGSAAPNISPGTNHGTLLVPDIEMATFWGEPLKPKPPASDTRQEIQTIRVENISSDSSDSDEGGQIITIHSPQLVRTEKE